MLPDIDERIAADFLQGERDEARAILHLLNNESDEMTPRVLRCVVFLASGDIEMLVHYADRARMDWRDVIYWAEYNEQENHMRDFTQPFPHR